LEIFPPNFGLGNQFVHGEAVEVGNVAADVAGVDFMKPFQPKFTDRNRIGQLDFTIMILHGFKIP
jgi:hypothetical protein